MTIERDATNWRREELLSLLSTSGNLAGLCITVVALMNTFSKGRADVTIVDDVLAVCAAAFLLCIYIIFWALRTKAPDTFDVLVKAVDAVFFLTLAAMTIVAFMIVYTIW
ncbi:MAG: hypothetical protein ACJ8G2_17300 [Burkholderiales bacterium]|jgi:hypothetical protein